MKIKGKEIVGQFLNSADQGTPEFMRLYNMLIWGLKTEFNLDITGTFKTVVLDVNANKTVSLPCDYIHYSKIGFINSIGEVVTFKRNDQLTTMVNNLGVDRFKGSPSTGSGIGIIGSLPYNSLNYNNYWANGSSYQLFGADSGTVTRGEYKVDDDQRLIFLSPQTYTSQIVLEYLGDGYDDECCDYSVDVRAAECMMAYLRWRNAIDMPKKYNQSQIDGFKKEFYRNKRLTKMRLNPFVLNEMQAITHASNKLVAKS